MGNWNSVNMELTNFRISRNDIETERKFCELNGLTKIAGASKGYNSKRILSIGRILGWSRNEDVPYLDHGKYYKNNKTGVCCLVYHPYQKVDAIKQAVTEWADEQGLKCSFSDYSWYYPGATCCVVVSLPNVMIRTSF